MKKIITIIGCGAVGAAQLYHLVDQLIEDNIAEYFEILIFEKSSSIGHGLAYAQDDNTIILNRSAETMSLKHNKPTDFISWIIENQSKWKNIFPKLSINKSKETFLPRSLFGIYVEDVIQQTMMRARRHKLKISIIHDEVISIQKENEKYKTNTNNGWQFYSDIVILTIGNLPSKKFESSLPSDRYFTTPYPTKKLNHIPLTASVGIIGSRLSAIDAAITLKESGHKGNIAFIARNGYLPAVRAPYRHHELKILTSQSIRECVSKDVNGLRLKQVLKMLIKEVSLIYGNPTLLTDWLERPLNPKEHFEKEFKTYNSKKNIAWQSVLIGLNQIIERIWHDLNESDKEMFIQLYRSKWMAYRVGIPFQNAIKIYNLFVSNQLVLIKFFENLRFQKNKFLVITRSGQFDFDYIVDATGNCTDIHFINSSLLLNLHKEGLIKPHKYGGLEVDFHTSRVVKMNNSIEKNLFAIGNLTAGTYFFTSVLDLNIKHSVNVAKIISSDFITAYQVNAKSKTVNYYMPRHQEMLSSSLITWGLL